MVDKQSLIIELAAHGIAIDENGQCSFYRNGEHKFCGVEEYLNYLKGAIKKNKQMLVEMWTEVTDLISARSYVDIGGSDVTQRMFISAVKHFYIMSLRFHALTKSYPVMRNTLDCDSAMFSENFMSKVIDYRVCIDWLHHLIREDKYRMSLLREYSKTVKTAEYDYARNPGGNYGTFPLSLRERMWPAEEDQTDRDDAKQDPVFNWWTLRHELPSSYNKPELEEGFVWREFRNDPFMFNEDREEEDSPYPGYQNYEGKGK